MWLAISTGPDELHLIPNNDLVEHTEHEECICGPMISLFDNPRPLKVVTHCSLDGRERLEPDWKS